MEIINLVFKAIDEINQQLPKEDHLHKSLDTVFFGTNGNLDSLGLINLIVAVEQNIEDEFDITITLADEKAMSQKHSPFRTVESLVNYIGLILKENLND